MQKLEKKNKVVKSSSELFGKKQAEGINLLKIKNKNVFSQFFEDKETGTPQAPRACTEFLQQAASKLSARQGALKYI